MKQLTLLAPAKINLALNITGQYPDGYHQMEMLMQSIGVYDTIHLQEIENEIQLSNSIPELPDDKENLAYRAAELILREYYPQGGIAIHLEKKIPIAAGLAGGSTDAAAVLRGINQLFELQLDYQQLIELAGQLGSDVPFCVRGGTAYAYGKGDQLEQLPDLPQTFLVLITPPISVSTAWIYQQYDIRKPEMGVPTIRLKSLIENEENIYWNEGWNNILEYVTTALVKDIKEIKEMLRARGALISMMSGSGPTVFAIVESARQADDIINNWPRNDDTIFSTYFVRQDFTD